MKRTVLVIILALTLGHANGQRAKFDSLINIALANRFEAKIIDHPNRDSLFNRLQFTKSTDRRIALIFTIINNGQETSKDGLVYYNKILAWAKKNRDPVAEAIITSQLGYNFYVDGDDFSGLKLLLDALKLAQATGNARAIGIANNNIGLYYGANDLKRYKQYTSKALYFSKIAHDDKIVAMETLSLGSILYSQKKPDSGQMFFYKGLELATRINDLQELARTIAIISGQEKVDSLKLRYLMARTVIATTAKSKLNMSHAFDGLADYYLNHHNIDSGLYYGHKAYLFAIGTSLMARVRASKLLYQLYDGGNSDSSLKYTKIYTQLRDSATNVQKIQSAQNLAFTEQQREQEIAKQQQDFQTRFRFYTLIIITSFLLLLAFVLWRNYSRSSKANVLLREQKLQTEQTLAELKVAQSQLIQSEKMVSLGQITAGIAHEIRNPLNFVNNFSDVSIDMLEQLKGELQIGNTHEAIVLANDLTQVFKKIGNHGKRADGIVKSMMRSRADTAVKEPTDLNQLTELYFNLAYQDRRAKDNKFNIKPIKKYGDGLPPVNLIQQDMGRVFLNLFNNAFYAVQQKQKNGNGDYMPVIEIKTYVKPSGGLAVAVKDNGIGIPNKIIQKIMQPFFTTKPPGEGTGLGLSLSYDIVVKGHGGKIEVTSNEGQGTEFVVSLPFAI